MKNKLYFFVLCWVFSSRAITAQQSITGSSYSQADIPALGASPLVAGGLPSSVTSSATRSVAASSPEKSDPESQVNTFKDSPSGSVFISMDSWIYPAIDRLASMGYVNYAFFGLRPWTRSSVLHLIERAMRMPAISSDEGAMNLCLVIQKEVNATQSEGVHIELDEVYARILPIVGDNPLTSSFEFGQTVINDFGRPYAHGINAITGFQARGEYGRFSLGLRAEYQHADGYAALPLSVQSIIAGRNTGPGFDVLTPEQQFGVGARNNFRLIDANLSYHVWGMEISAGKSEMWWGPNQGGAFLASTNAEPLYSFRINRVEPLYIPYFSKIFGPIRFDNYFGDLKGHVSPNMPWIFGNKISIHPWKNLELGFSRSCTFAGKGYSPLTFGTFWNCFASAGDFLQAGLRQYDVGDRRANFDFRLQLPSFLRSVTVYTDSLADDDPSPLANPPRSGWAPGIYISPIPGLKKFDLRFEAPYTNAKAYPGGAYTNHGYRDGFTNKGQVIGYWIGRDSAGYQAWLTYWLSPMEKFQLQFRDAKLDQTLWTGGGTQTDISFSLTKRLGDNYEIATAMQFERYMIPILHPDSQRNVAVLVQVRWQPKLQLHR